MAPPSILVVGCGVAGPIFATCLLLSQKPANERPHITILERSSALRVQGQNIDIRGAGATIIRKLGMETIIRSLVTNEEGTRFVDKNNRSCGDFPADKTGKIQTGTSDIEILRGTLAKICFERSKTAGAEAKRDGGKDIEYIFGDTLDEIVQDDQKVHVHFAKSGERRSFDLLVGADGLQSRTRKLVFGESGEKDRVKSLSMYCGFFSMPRGKTDSLWARWFHAPGRRSIIVRPGETKNVATVLMAVLNDEDERLKKAASDGHAGVKAQKALLAEYFQDAGWESPRIIQEMHAADDFYYDMVGQIKMDKWSKGRVVLLGDAGYCGSPVSGMGTTLALTGAYNLAGAIDQNSGDYAAAFAQYEQQMRPTVDRAQKLFPGAPRIANPETSWGIMVMHLILGFITFLKLDMLMFKLAGPPAGSVPVLDYGFRTLPEIRV